MTPGRLLALLLALAADRARAQGVPTLERDLSLDRDPDAGAVTRQRVRLERMARRQSAIPVPKRWPLSGTGCHKLRYAACGSCR